MALLTPVSYMPTLGDGTSRSVAAPPAIPETIELRLGVVCDGGVSLAIYEHGVTKELQNLVIASRAYDDVASKSIDHDSARSALSGSQQQFFDVLANRAEAGRPLSVVIDIISGTSAGGINGVCLAKALAHNLSQDPLTKVWMERADIGKLAHRGLPGVKGAIASAVILLPWMIRKRWSPLHGDLMSQWLVEALDAMDAAPIPGTRDTLIPPNHDLDLFVTATDLHGYQRIVPSPDGGPGEHDRTNRKVFHFQTTAAVDPDRFGPADNSGLAFAARCTSSFPGAFAPNNLEHFSKITKRHSHTPFDRDGFIAEHLAEYQLSGESAMTTHFADGGLLNNSPFDHVIAAVSAKNAQSQVDRRIIHIDPDPGPGSPIADPDRVAPAEWTPSWVGGLRSSLSVRSSQSRVADLLKVQSLNNTIGQVGRIATNLDDTVYEYLQEVAATHQSSIPSWDVAADWADDVHQKVAEVAGSWNVQTYQRLKVSIIGQMMANDLADALGYPSEVQQFDFMSCVFAAWFDGDPFWTTTLTPEDLTAFLNASDMPYKERRLRFLIAGVSGLYSRPEFDGSKAQSLNELKAAGWGVLDELITFRGDTARTIGEGAEFLDAKHLAGPGIYENPTKFVDDHKVELAELIKAYVAELATYRNDSAAALWKTFVELTIGWTPRTACDLLYRFLGFPLWDALTYPVIALSELPQLSPIQLQRFSPRDSDLLQLKDKQGKPREKLQGTSVHHFGGFLNRAWRENDYLWGRLDATAFILEILGEDGWTPATHDAFAAVLDEESPMLREVGDLIKELRGLLTDKATKKFLTAAKRGDWHVRYSSAWYGNRISAAIRHDRAALLRIHRVPVEFHAIAREVSAHRSAGHSRPVGAGRR
ncbi:MAG: hypothetical protein JWM76_799 [Pseudonocardiales bacterium]|nr:hypothetical protein [Pseudonocardiales bacterium]